MHIFFVKPMILRGHVFFCRERSDNPASTRNEPTAPRDGKPSGKRPEDHAYHGQNDTTLDGHVYFQILHVNVLFWKKKRRKTSKKRVSVECCVILPVVCVVLRSFARRFPVPWSSWLMACGRKTIRSIAATTKKYINLEWKIHESCNFGGPSLYRKWWWHWFVSSQSVAARTRFRTRTNIDVGTVNTGTVKDLCSILTSVKLDRKLSGALAYFTIYRKR